MSAKVLLRATPLLSVRGWTTMIFGNKLTSLLARDSFIARLKMRLLMNSDFGLLIRVIFGSSVYTIYGHR